MLRTAHGAGHITLCGIFFVGLEMGDILAHCGKLTFPPIIISSFV